MFAPHLQTELPGTIGFGPLRFPLFALFATAGLIAGLAGSQRSAPLAGVDRNRLWDAGVFAVAAAFVISRLLLVLGHLDIFRAVPMLVLQLPSITYSGLLLTAAATLLWLRWKRVPLLRALDAWAPCVALGCAFLSVGHFFEGTEGGMPTTLPWGIVATGDTMLGHTHPVQLYAAAGALLLLGLLWGRLKLPRSHAGSVAALGLLLGSTGSFLLGFFRQPASQELTLPLDPGQFFALTGALVGVALWFWTARTNPSANGRLPGHQRYQEFDHAK
ncbi:MAG: prolipoprotein diacylglyceryl transferase [Acidobacteriaceae bacterium]|nr:prolipoprotein diacylglyceryl transferase [Acidobacteriaceae bacterium]